MLDAQKPYLRDGIDVYLADNDTLIFVYLATRKRVSLKIDPSLFSVLPLLDGTRNIHEVYAHIIESGASISLENVQKFVSFLQSKAIVIDRAWLKGKLTNQEILMFERTLNFFLDVEGSERAAINLFKAITNTKICIFGVGAVGSWIFFELLRLGFKKFVLVDPATLEDTDIARFAYFDANKIGQPKIDICRERAAGFSKDIHVELICDALDFNTDVAKFIPTDVDILVNCADEPYIGSTNIKLSRYVIKNNKALIAAGGFDAHLGSLSETIVHNLTPCADCYANFFDESLKDWKPIKHPISERSFAFGGLSSLAVFAAANATLKILNYIKNDTESWKGGRGELVFQNYSIDKFEVLKDPNCRVCS